MSTLAITIAIVLTLVATVTCGHPIRAQSSAAPSGCKPTVRWAVEWIEEVADAAINFYHWHCLQNLTNICIGPLDDVFYAASNATIALSKVPMACDNGTATPKQKECMTVFRNESATCLQEAKLIPSWFEACGADRNGTDCKTEGAAVFVTFAKFVALIPKFLCLI